MDSVNKQTPDPSTLENHLEALLFYYNEATTLKKLGKILKCSTDEISTALKALKTKRKDTGLHIIFNSHEAQLVASIADERIIDELGASARNVALSDASKETLSIILYLDNPTEAVIDAIRGVKSARIIKKLVRQGYVKMVEGYLNLTSDALVQLGITSITDLEDADVIKMKLESLANAT